MKKSISVALVVALPLFLAGCGNDGPPVGSIFGSVGGAVLGGVLGHQIGSGLGRDLATAAGATIGGGLGSWYGHKADQKSQDPDPVDQKISINTTQAALEYTRDGATSMWQNPHTGAQGRIRILKTFTDAKDRTCRQYDQSFIKKEGPLDPKVQHNVACRGNDGLWQITKSQASQQTKVIQPTNINQPIDLNS